MTDDAKFIWAMAMGRYATSKTDPDEAGASAIAEALAAQQKHVSHKGRWRPSLLVGDFGSEFMLSSPCALAPLVHQGVPKLVLHISCNSWRRDCGSITDSMS